MTEIENVAKAYELRKLTADDIFPMLKIISKIGIKEFKSCIESADVKAAIANMGKDKGDSLNAVGLTVALDVVDVLTRNLPKCREDIYALLAQLSGLSVKDIAALPLPVFFEMIVDLVKKEEFKDFFQVAAKLLR